MNTQLKNFSREFMKWWLKWGNETWVVDDGQSSSNKTVGSLHEVAIIQNLWVTPHRTQSLQILYCEIPQKPHLKDTVHKIADKSRLRKWPNKSHKIWRIPSLNRNEMFIKDTHFTSSSHLMISVLCGHAHAHQRFFSSLTKKRHSIQNRSRFLMSFLSRVQGLSYYERGISLTNLKVHCRY